MKFNDQFLANQLLKRKELGGRHLPFSKRQKIGYALWGVLLLIAIILLNINPDNSVATFFIGLVIAAVGREYVWYKATRVVWPFTERVIDWEKVNQLSKSESEQDAPCNHYQPFCFDDFPLFHQQPCMRLPP